MKSDNIWLKRLIESVAKRDKLEALAFSAEYILPWWWWMEYGDANRN